MDERTLSAIEKRYEMVVERKIQFSVKLKALFSDLVRFKKNEHYFSLFLSFVKLGINCI